MYLPSRIAQIDPPERERFFADLGRQVEQEILTLQPALAGPDPQDEG